MAGHVYATVPEYSQPLVLHVSGDAIGDGDLGLACVDER